MSAQFDDYCLSSNLASSLANEMADLLDRLRVIQDIASDVERLSHMDRNAFGREVCKIVRSSLISGSSHWPDALLTVIKANTVLYGRFDDVKKSFSKKR